MAANQTVIPTFIRFELLVHAADSSTDKRIHRKQLTLGRLDDRVMSVVNTL